MKTKAAWDAAKAVLREKLIAIKSYLKNWEKCQIYNQILPLKQRKKEEPKVSEGKKL